MAGNNRPVWTGPNVPWRAHTARSYLRRMLRRTLPPWTTFPLVSPGRARRNAHRAAIEAAIRRRQREDVAAFLERHAADPGPDVARQAGL